jgi:two-component system response regulator (stage 0 sporulation protein F)
MEKKDITILYVDDEQVNLRIFEINFRKRYNVITAVSGEQGLEKLEENGDIIVVVSDMKMPGMNGIEFIKKAREKYTHVVYFILTGFDITIEIADALNENIIQKYFRKPFNLKEISEAIDNAIDKLE